MFVSALSRCASTHGTTDTDGAMADALAATAAAAAEAAAAAADEAEKEAPARPDAAGRASYLDGREGRSGDRLACFSRRFLLCTAVISCKSSWNEEART